MKTKNLFLLFTSSLLLNISCVTYSKSGIMTKEKRNISTFSKIEAGSAVEVYFTQAETQSVVIEADSSIHDKVETICDGEKLIIGVKFKKISIRIPDVKVYVSAPALNEIDFSGASAFCADSLSFNRFFKISISGASKIKIKHLQANELNADISGASNLNAAVDISGNINVEASGASNVKLSGKCNGFSVEATGASNINIKELKFNNITKLDISGASSIGK